MLWNRKLTHRFPHRLSSRTTHTQILYDRFRATKSIIYLEVAEFEPTTFWLEALVLCHPPCRNIFMNEKVPGTCFLILPCILFVSVYDSIFNVVSWPQRAPAGRRFTFSHLHICTPSAAMIRCSRSPIRNFRCQTEMRGVSQGGVWGTCAGNTPQAPSHLLGARLASYRSSPPLFQTATPQLSSHSGR